MAFFFLLSCRRLNQNDNAHTIFCPELHTQQLDDPPVLPEEAIWYVVKQVATGLDQLHTKGLVHMDIKPDNILISDTGVLKLGDLGTYGSR